MTRAELRDRPRASGAHMVKQFTMPVSMHRLTGTRVGNSNPLIGFNYMQGTCTRPTGIGGNQPPLHEHQRSRLQAALLKVAKLSTDDPVYLPVFERLERELVALANQNDALERARMMAHQSTMG